MELDVIVCGFEGWKPGEGGLFPCNKEAVYFDCTREDLLMARCYEHPTMFPEGYSRRITRDEYIIIITMVA